ncbi:hypothetical protein BTM25_12390 [Actinomadura rubteroloni]|uniref:Uncharacterized protein n=1 Tax=Actinomadura rubteroloni TaxID=1926885 RepID=A0A2P4UP54_9ACTN|nr:hypothetical protein [Actinomadura rubteroloni]POM26831.1 hypothetical protein BTM25_12390 [Actinomadura rubteroloni]
MKNKLLLVPALALVLSAAACGGDDKASDPPSSGTTPTSTATAQPSQNGATPSASATNGGGGGSAYASDMEKVAACMRAKGYDAQVPPGGNIPILKNIKDQAKASGDLKKCQEKILAPPGG